MSFHRDHENISSVIPKYSNLTEAIYSMKYPRIHLALDNVSLIKRWATPLEWMSVIKEIKGLNLIEASTDNEIDPNLCTPRYIKKWIKDAKYYQDQFGLKIFSFFSGYITYRSLGLTHNDKGIRDKLINNWFKKAVRMAADLNAEIGCNLNAFSDQMLSSQENYELASERFNESLGILAQHAHNHGVRLSYEQMYTPTQGFWTIDECKLRMKKVLETVNAPLYVTIDTGHHIGQKNYLSREPILLQNKYLYAREKDTDIYNWLKELGCYSPIIHLQQTDGNTSSHRPFTDKWNSCGTIFPMKVLSALKESYDQTNDDSMPEKVADIHLVFEPFFSVTEKSEEVKEQIQETVNYWRNIIPQDGIHLDKLF